MRDLIERFDWAATPFGARSGWPVNLEVVLGLMLDSSEALAIWWGHDGHQIFNDAYAARLPAGEEARALGQSAASYWQDGWLAVAPHVRRVLASASSICTTNALVPLERNGRFEDTYWRYSFTPVRTASGAAGGVLVISTEITAQILTARRQQMLDWLRQESNAADTREALHALAAAAPDLNGDDVIKVSMTPLTAPPAVGIASDTQVRITAPDVGIEADLALAFAVSPKVALDDALRLFLEQFTVLVASARRRIDTEAARRVTEAERDRLLLDAPVGAAVMVGPELVYHLVNPIYAMVSGRPAEAMVGKPFVEVYPELDGSPVHASFQNVYRAGEPFVSPQPMLVQIHRNGGALDDRYFTYNLSPLRTLEGRVYGLMVIAVDVTVQVEARAEVEGLNLELQAAARAKDEFLALLGHELRNPLAPIVTALELMGMRDRSTDREQVIIRRQVHHLTRLVDDLLDVSRITRGKVELRKQAMNVDEVLLQAVEMVSPLIERKQQVLRVSVEPLRWYGDPARLAQIASNLLTNANRYSPAKASISLTSSVRDGQLEITVSDNGIGIGPDLLPHIFAPFFQGERKLHGAVGGLGIGLALVRNLAEMHGGTAVAHSPGSGQGSTFTVRLPLSEAPSTAVPGAQTAPSQAAQQARRSVLVVDDNIDAADTLADMLRTHGHRVSVAYTTQTALQAFVAGDIDLAVLDIGLPDISGYQLAELMRASGHNSKARYVALTGFGQQFDKDRTAASGFAAHLVKPVSTDVINALLQETRPVPRADVALPTPIGPA